MTERASFPGAPFWHARSLQRQIGALFVLFGLLMALVLAIQGNQSQKLVVHPIWEQLLRAATGQYLADARPAASRQLPTTGPIRGWRLSGAGARSGMPAYFAGLAPGYYDEQRMDAYDSGRSYAVLVTPLAGGDRIVMAVDISDVENDQNMMGLASGLLALASGATMIVSILWVVRRMRRPVRALAARIDALDPEQPAQRLALDFPLRELNDIAALVNGHLDRVERFIERERSLLDQASHEFRTPIAVIAGAVDVLKLHELPSAAEAPLARIRATTDTLGEIMAALLFLSREGPQGAPLESTRLDALLELLVEDHQHLLENKHVHFVIEELQPLWIDGPEALARIVVGNLLRNAAENSQQGAIRIRLAQDRLSIQDSGAGFDTVAAARRYTQALRNSAKQGGGQGLGLFLIRRVCERFGWMLKIASNPAQGTLAEIVFPLRRGEAQAGE